MWPDEEVVLILVLLANLNTPCEEEKTVLEKPHIVFKKQT